MESIKRIIIVLIFLILNNNLSAIPIEGNIVSLQILDKITARIFNIEIPVGQKINFGSLEIEIFNCKKRPPEEIPEDFILLRIIDEVSHNNFQQVFQGWMLSSSP